MKKITLYFISFLVLTIIGLQSCGVKEHKSSSRPISHASWDTLLQKYVTEEGKVNYQGFINEKENFDRYITLLKNNHPNKKNWSSEERLAYWINAYNAFTVKIIVDNYPVKSIKNIKDGIPFVNTVWDIKFINIEGAEYDLNNIEHGIIRAQYDEPRIHFAVNCASISCPRLRNEAYFPDRLEAQLTDQARYFFQNPVKNKIDANTPKLSKLLSWYRTDFDNEGTVIDFINKYSDIKIKENATIEYLDYDWNLNE